MGEGYLRDMLNLLADDLDNYDKIIFFETSELVPIFHQLRLFDIPNQNILVLSTYSPLPDSQTMTFRQISKREARQITELYFTYEFSDRFLLVSSKSTDYGDLYHMIDAGILTLEEFAAALLN